MSDTEFAGPTGTLSHPEGELVDPDAEAGAEQPEAIDGPEAPAGEPQEPVEGEGGDEDDEQAQAPPPVDGTGEQLGITAEALEEMMTKLANSAKTWRKRVRELLGDNADALVACELCEADIPGFHWPAELVQPESPLHERLLEVLLTEDGPGYQPAPHVHECETCAGLGKVATGSKVGGKTTVFCPECRGTGYFPPPPRGQAAQPAATEGGEGAPLALVEPLEDLPGGQVREVPADGAAPVWQDRSKPDPWGSPGYLSDGQENPNWGHMPQYKDPDLP